MVHSTVCGHKNESFCALSTAQEHECTDITGFGWDSGFPGGCQWKIRIYLFCLSSIPKGTDPPTMMRHSADLPHQQPTFLTSAESDL